MSDRLIGLLLLVISGLLYWQTFFFKRPPFAQFEQMGSESFPRGILIGLAILSFILLVRGEGSLRPSWTLDSVRALFTRYREVLLSLLLFPAYALAIDLVGFFYSTMVYLIVMQLMLRPRRGRALAHTVVGSIAFTWGLVTLFEGYLNVVLPSGTLF